MNGAGPAPPGEVSIGRIFGAMVAGYVAAAFAATITYMLALLPVAENLTGYRPVMVVVGTVFAMVYALPGFVIVRSVLPLLNFRSVPAYALSAGIAAVVTMILPHLVSNSTNLTFLEPAVTIVVALAGAAAGATYRTVERWILNRR
jgi:hypothetical protein